MDIPGRNFPRKKSSKSEETESDTTYKEEETHHLGIFRGR